MIRDSFDNDQIERNDGFTGEMVMEHLEIRTHLINQEEESGTTTRIANAICVVCQSESMKKTKNWDIFKRCGHEYQFGLFKDMVTAQ